MEIEITKEVEAHLSDCSPGEVVTMKASNQIVLVLNQEKLQKTIIGGDPKNLCVVDLSQDTLVDMPKDALVIKMDATLKVQKA